MDGPLPPEPSRPVDCRPRRCRQQPGQMTGTNGRETCVDTEGNERRGMTDIVILFDPE